MIDNPTVLFRFLPWCSPFVLLRDKQIYILCLSISLARSVNTTTDLAERVLFKEEGIRCFSFFVFFFAMCHPFSRDRAVTWEECHAKWAIFLYAMLYGRWQEGTFNEYYLSDILEMSRRVQRPHCFPLRCDVRFRISPADIVKPNHGSAGLVTAPNLVRCAALNSYLSAAAAERPSKAVTG